MELIQKVTISLPKNDNLSEQLFAVLSHCGIVNGNTFTVHPSNQDYLPIQVVKFEGNPEPSICFDTSDGRLVQSITNETGKDKASPHIYEPLSIEEVVSRLHHAAGITKIDHLGVNFPWFDGLSPTLAKLRNELKDKSAYYLFPDGQPWDFILPATRDEIESRKIDLTKERRPKLELVSFEKASRPLIQIDCITDASYIDIKNVFPEGILSDELSNVWVYIETPMDVDLCLVLNENTDQDWSNYFDGHRLT